MSTDTMTSNSAQQHKNDLIVSNFPSPTSLKSLIKLFF